MIHQTDSPITTTPTNTVAGNNSSISSLLEECMPGNDLESSRHEICELLSNSRGRYTPEISDDEDEDFDEFDDDEEDQDSVTCKKDGDSLDGLTEGDFAVLLPMETASDDEDDKDDDDKEKYSAVDDPNTSESR